MLEIQSFLQKNLQIVDVVNNYLVNKKMIFFFRRKKKCQIVCNCSITHILNTNTKNAYLITDLY